VFYFREKGECDFVAISQRTKRLYQVTLSPDNEREVFGLREAMRTLRLSIGYIVTQDKEGIINIPEGKIKILPLAKFLLEDSQ